MSGRTKWTSAFFNAGIEKNDMMAMSEEQFQETCQFLRESGLATDDMLDDEDLQKALAASLEPKQSVPVPAPTPTPVPTPTPFAAPKIEKPKSTGWNFSGKWNTSAWSTGFSSQKTTPKAPVVEQPKKQETKPLHFGFQPFMHHSPKPAEKPPIFGNESHRIQPRKHTISGEIRNAQDAEYEQCQKEAIEKERRQREEEARQLRELEEKETREKEQKAQLALRGEQLKNSLKESVQALGPEPAQGVQLAIQMPSKKRIMRKFAKERSCDDLFLVVAAEDEMFDEDLNQLEFSLHLGTGLVEKGKTFEEQGITRRTLINVILE